MNRIRLWLYAALVLVAGLANLYFVSTWVAARSVAQLDRELRAAVAQLDARTRLAASEATDLAAEVARAPAVVAALAADGDALAPAEDALRAAAGAARIEPRGLLVAVATPRGVQARAGGEPVTLPDAAWVTDAQRGTRRDGVARVGQALWAVAGVPAGRGGAVVVGRPLDAAVAAAVRGATAADVTLVVDGKVAASTLEAPAAGAVAAAATLPARKAADLGRLGAVRGSLPFATPVLFARAPEHRVLPLPVEGAAGAVAVLSVAATPHLSGVATYQGVFLVALLLLVALGVLLGLLATEGGVRPLPRELLSAAERIARGDFAARAPRLAGGAGLVAEALNRAAERASVAGAPAAPEPDVSRTQPLVGAPPPPEPVDEVSPATTPPAEAPGAAASGATVEPVPASPPSAADPEAREPSFGAPAPEAPPDAAGWLAPPLASALETTPDPLAVPELPPPPPLAEFPPAGVADDESHWRSVFEEFLRVRGDTGEAARPVSYDRFRGKLATNRAELVQRYGCRTVRFQVYVKEGKAAVRATPVR